MEEFAMAEQDFGRLSGIARQLTADYPTIGSLRRERLRSAFA
jgi:hypothetical protein